MSKQETLEEAAMSYLDRTYSLSYERTTWQKLHEKTFAAGAKWQAERMYSEEDMINFHKWAYQKNRIEESDKTTKELLNEWFEQFKKKGGDK